MTKPKRPGRGGRVPFCAGCGLPLFGEVPWTFVRGDGRSFGPYHEACGPKPYARRKLHARWERGLADAARKLRKGRESDPLADLRALVGTDLACDVLYTRKGRRRVVDLALVVAALCRLRKNLADHVAGHVPARRRDRVVRRALRTGEGLIPTATPGVRRLDEGRIGYGAWKMPEGNPDHAFAAKARADLKIAGVPGLLKDTGRNLRDQLIRAALSRPRRTAG